ncbi:MAG TPA: Asp-tRNA(Asn)/Glu-tRNA(Gln) amidotransferase subunit GatA [Longimicrobiales bacterium]|nr:Asp-tRNA(Asn)/Glu-tRNA(Gln) amidotransferase subunit GatA [Longimicrobiales bacterium]
MAREPAPSLDAIAAAVLAGETSAVALLEAAEREQARREAADPPLNAFLAFGGEHARASADAADARVRAGESTPLAGVPVAVKDNLCTLDYPTTCGSRILEGYVSPYEATVVRRLREAGAVVVGKTNLDEFAMGSSTEHSAWGPTRNPHDAARVPGGSSGGSAAAVAAGIVPVALGSETGGSVRQPAALCGIVGVKPTYGRVSRYGLVAFASSLDQVGVMARSVADAARVTAIIAGEDPLDSTAALLPVPDYVAEMQSGLDGLVVGIPDEFFPDELDAGMRAACEAAIDVIRATGAEVRRVSLPHTTHAIPTYYLIAPAEASSNLARFDGVRYGLRAAGATTTEDVYYGTRAQGFGDEVKRRIMLGTYALSAGYHDEYYDRAQRARALIARDFARVFADGVDVLFTPTTPTTAFLIGENDADPYRMYLADTFTVPANLAGVPAISVPIGTAGGLPVGGQFMAPMFGETAMFAAAYGLERALAGGAE